MNTNLEFSFNKLRERERERSDSKLTRITSIEIRLEKLLGLQMKINQLVSLLVSRLINTNLRLYVPRAKQVDGQSLDQNGGASGKYWRCENKIFLRVWTFFFTFINFRLFLFYTVVNIFDTAVCLVIIEIHKTMKEARSQLKKKIKTHHIYKNTNEKPPPGVLFDN